MSNVTKIIQIVPKIGRSCGVADYSIVLAHQLYDSHGIGTEFAAASVTTDEGDLAANFRVHSLKSEFEGLFDRLEGTSYSILLHYVGYGFAKRGCPLWLLFGLRQWRRENPNGRLVTMFHELYASGRPWQSSCWTSPVQRWICRELAGLSDSVATNRGGSAGILKRMTGRDDVLNLPVFSNVGEPDKRIPIEKREARLVIFGGSEWRSTALVRDRGEIRATCRKWGIQEVVEIGAGETPEVDFGLPMRRMGKLSVDEISSWLSRSRLGFVSYPSTYLEKSGIFAAYAAHGVVPILPERSMIKDTLGVVAGRHYISAGQRDISPSYLDDRSQDVFSWYQGHRVNEHARIFANLLRI